MLTSYSTPTTDLLETPSGGSSESPSIKRWAQIPELELTRGNLISDPLDFALSLPILDAWHLFANHAPGEIPVFHYITTSEVSPEIVASIGETIDIGWFFEGIALPEEKEISVEEVAQFIKGVNYIISEERFDLLAKLTRSISDSNAPSQILLAFLRSTYPVRSKFLPDWKLLVQDAKIKLESRGVNAEKLLKGLM